MPGTKTPHTIISVGTAIVMVTNTGGHGAFDDKCPVLREYLVHLDRVQKEKDALRRNITAQVAKTITGAAEAKQINPNPQVPGRQPIIKAARKIISKTPTKEVINVSDVITSNDVNNSNDVVTKTEVMALIGTIDEFLADKFGWENKGQITELAKTILYGKSGDVEMTSSTPTKPGGQAQPRNIFINDFTATPEKTNNTAKALPNTPNLHIDTANGQHMLAHKNQRNTAHTGKQT